MHLLSIKKMLSCIGLYGSQLVFGETHRLEMGNACRSTSDVDWLVFVGKNPLYTGKSLSCIGLYGSRLVLGKTNRPPLVHVCRLTSDVD
jgi:hypothetical protein